MPAHVSWLTELPFIVTFFSIVTTIVLFQGLQAPVVQIITLVMGFLVICVGITVLQLSKIDPTQIKKLDRRSTLLLQAARTNTEGVDEKDLAAIEDPGMDALRGSFGTMGSIIRARSARRLSMNSRASASIRSRYSAQPPPLGQTNDPLAGVKRHQLFDNPMPATPEAGADGLSDRGSMMTQPSGLGSPFSQRKQTIKFGDQDVVHSYHVPGTGDDSATHERRNVRYNSGGSVKYDSVSSGGWSSKAVVGTNGEQTPTSGSQILHLPPIESREELNDSSVPLTAPPTFGGDSADPFHRPRLTSSPFEGLPSTATLTSFPSATSTSSSSPGGRHGPSTPTKSSRLPLFGRSPSSRHYPRGDREEDREESISLWNRPSTESLDTSENSSDSDLPGGGIRLVPSSNPRDRTDVL